MIIEKIYSPQELTELAKSRFEEERGIDHLEGWFLAKEIAMECDMKFKNEPDSLRIGKTLVEIMKQLPLSLGDYHVFAGTQDDAFARSYALINPAFRVSSFTGYCDPVAVFGDIEPIGDITKERIARVKDYYSKNEFAEALTKAYAPVEKYTEEAVFFLEQVTGHVIPDVREYLAKGALKIREELVERQAKTEDTKKKEYYEAMCCTIDALLVLAERYRKLALWKADNSKGKTKARFELMADTLARVPA